MKQNQLYTGLVLWFGILIYPLCGIAQPVYNKVIAPFTPIYNGESEWVDLDSDNDLDLIQFGDISTYVPTTLVYENTNGNFTIRTSGLPNVHYGSMATGDYDKDGDPDILISGSISQNNENISAIYRNDGGFIFTHSYTLRGLSNSTVEWFDADNDEDLDIIMTGSPDNTFNFITVLLENTGTGFTEVNGSNLPNCSFCSLDLADGNGDGRTDVLLAGSYETALYLNNGNKTFSKDLQAPFKQVYGAINWGDFDTDGDLDVSLSGSDLQYNYHSLIYENTSGSYIERTDIGLLPLAVNKNGALWFDYNNDSRLDLLLMGTDPARLFTHRLYKNNGGGSFGETMEPSFDELVNSSFDIGDFDNDGDPDISFEGFMPYSRYPLAGYYKNMIQNGTPTLNTKPLPPSSATFTETSYRTEIRFKWSGGTDAQTPVDGLTYNFYLRDATKKIVIPAVDFSTGYLRTTNPANGFGRHGFASHVPEGPLYYAVQSIDGSKAGSVFSAEKMFYHFNGPECVKAEIIDDTHVKLTWLDHSSLETNFKVERSTSAQTGFTQVATLPANTVTNTNNFSFLTETYYYYRVTGYNATHTSPYDSLILMIPERITGLTAESVNASTIQLHWQDHSQFETGFLVERKKSTESIFATVATLQPGTEFYEDQGLEQGTTYDYRIRTISKNGGLPPLITASAKTNYYPIGTDFQKEVSEDTSLPMTAADFESHFTDPDPADHLVRIKIKTLPTNGTVRVSGSIAAIDQEISLSELNAMEFEPEPNFAGISTFSVYAYDGKDYSLAPWNITINVNQVNDQPIFDIIPVKEVEEDFWGNVVIYPSIEYTPYEYDQTMTFSLSPRSSEKVNIQFDEASGGIILTAIKDKFGEIDFTLTVDDGQAENNLFSKNFKLKINPVNDPPVIGEIEDVGAFGGEVLSPIALNITDVDNIITPSMLSGSSGIQQILKNSNITFSQNVAGTILMHLTAENRVGQTFVNITVNDGAAMNWAFFNFHVGSVTAIEHTVESKFSVFPNPAANEVVVALDPTISGKYDLALQDILGHLVRSIKSEGSETVIDIKDLLPGIYVLTIAAENGVFVQKKFIKK